MITAIPAALPSLPAKNLSATVQSPPADECAWQSQTLSVKKCVRFHLIPQCVPCSPCYLSCQPEWTRTSFRSFVYFCSNTFTKSKFDALFIVHSINDDSYRLHIAHREGHCDANYPKCTQWTSDNWEGALSRPTC
jgi:hypothetical protein